MQKMVRATGSAALALALVGGAAQAANADEPGGARSVEFAATGVAEQNTRDSTLVVGMNWFQGDTLVREGGIGDPVIAADGTFSMGPRTPRDFAPGVYTVKVYANKTVEKLDCDIRYADGTPIAAEKKSGENTISCTVDIR